MTAFRLYLDAQGYVCGGYADTSARSSETWSMRHIPIVPTDEADVVWPDGVPRESPHIAQRFDDDPEAT